MKLCALLAILFIVKITSGQLEERCPSCCHHRFNETSIKTAGRPAPFWDCTTDEKSAINAARCFSECAYNLPPPKINLDYTPWPLIKLQGGLTSDQQGLIFQCFGRCLASLSPGYCNNCSDNDACMSVCTEFSLLLNETMNANKPSPPMHPAFYTSNSGGYQIRIEPRDSYFPDNTMDEGSGQPMNTQNLTYGFIIKLYTPIANKISYCSLVDINFGTFIRDIDHLCTPTQLSYAVVNRYGVSDYSPVNTECLGDYNVSDVRALNNIQTCVSKDLRPRYEGYDVVEISWETDSAHEPHCVGEYMIEVGPWPSQDNECKNEETVSAVVDKHSKSHQFLSSHSAIILFNDSCEYYIAIQGTRVPEILGREELIIDATVPACDENNTRPSILKMNIRSNKQSDFSYRVTLEWSVEYNIDVLESLDFFRIIVTTESRRSNIFVQENTIPAHDTNALIRPAYPAIKDFVYQCNAPFKHYNCVEACAAMDLYSSSATCLPSCDNVTRYQKELDHIFLPNTMENYIIVLFTHMTETSIICNPSNIMKEFNFTAFPPDPPINITYEVITWNDDNFTVSVSWINGFPGNASRYIVYVSQADQPTTYDGTEGLNNDNFKTTTDAWINATFMVHANLVLQIRADIIYEPTRLTDRIILAGTWSDPMYISVPSTCDKEDRRFTISFDRHNYEVYENNESAKFVLLHLSEPFECCSFSVQIEIVDVTAVGNFDYVFPRSGYIRVIFPAGIVSVSVPIRLIDDEIIEGTEYFNVSIVDVSLPHGVTVAGSPSASVNILDDDNGCVHFDHDSYFIRENMNSLPVTLTLTTVASYDIHVQIATAAYTARDCDYNYGPYIATFKAGNQRAVFRINIFNDDVYEKSEGFNFMIATTSTNAVSSCPPNKGSVTIMDDEKKISLSFSLSNYNVNEDTETLSPMLTLDKPSPCCITVLTELTDVSATGGGVDYGDPSPKIYKYIFPVGETSATPVEPISIINDNITESDETLKITTIKLSIPLGVQTRGDSAIITIKDDDSIEP